MDNVKIRTSAFGGFNKNDVLAYIDTLGRKAKSVEAGLNEKITELSASREELAARVDDFSSRISALETAYTRAQESAERNRLEREAARNEASELRRKAVVLEVENNKLKSQLSASEDSAKQLEDEKTKIADVILDARKNAQLIMNSARDEAVKKVRDAEEEINGLHNKVGGFIDDVESMKRSMAEMLHRVENNVADITLRLEELHKEVYKIDNSLKLITLDTGVSKLRLQHQPDEPDEPFHSDDSALG